MRMQLWYSVGITAPTVKPRPLAFTCSMSTSPQQNRPEKGSKPWENAATPARRVLGALGVDAPPVAGLDREAVVLVPHAAVVDVDVPPRDVKAFSHTPLRAPRRNLYRPRSIYSPIYLCQLYALSIGILILL